jgi:two-component system, OmpR family, sensor histidine kinase CiaH
VLFRSLVFAISLFLATKALVPIKNSWEKQRIFVSDASHELRTPLAVINTSLEIVLDNSSETIESQSKWLENIQSEVQRMSKLVNDLLFLARSDSNNDKLQMANFDLSWALMQLTEFFKPFTEDNGITLDFNIQPDVFYFGNEGRIKQLVTILIDNAVQHTAKFGKIELVMETRDSSIEISVKDNGSGIPQEHLTKIFERFYKVDKARTGNHNGSGLGLSIADCIAKEHSGSITVTSKVNEGSTFKIILPRS